MSGVRTLVRRPWDLWHQLRRPCIRLKTVPYMTKIVRKCHCRYLRGICHNEFSICSASGSHAFTKCPLSIFFGNRLITVVTGNCHSCTQLSRRRYPWCLCRNFGKDLPGAACVRVVTCDCPLRATVSSSCTVASHVNHIPFFRLMKTLCDISMEPYGSQSARTLHYITLHYHGILQLVLYTRGV